MNVILTTLSRVNSNNPAVNYYRYNNGTEDIYCSGIVSSEPAVKYFLSIAEIDKIIVMGSSQTYSPEEKAALDKGIIHFDAPTKALSYFVNGISDFVMGKNESKKEGSDFLNQLLSTECECIESLFEYCANHNKSNESFKQKLARISNASSFDEVKAEMWERLANDKKMVSKTAKMPEIIFIHSENNKAESSLLGLLENITSFGTVDNLYIDVQGGSRTDGVVRNAALSFFSGSENIKNKFYFSVDFMYDNFVHTIVDEKKQYGLNELVAAINAFTHYGRVSLLEKYKGKYHDYLDLDFFAIFKEMKKVENGLVLCNLKGFKDAVADLKESLKKAEATKNTITAIVKETVSKEFEIVLKDSANSSDYINWAMEHEFLQQALTFAEAAIPEYIVSSGICRYHSNEETLSVLNELCEKTRKNNEHDKNADWMFYDVDHWFINNLPYQTGTGNGIFNSNVGFGEQIKFDIFCDESVFFSMFHDYKNSIVEFRNKLNHASGEITDINTIINVINRSILRLNECIDDLKNKYIDDFAPIRYNKETKCFYIDK